MQDLQVGDPGQFAVELAILREMGWTWDALQQTPQPVVQELAWRIGFERKWLHVKKATGE